MDTGMTAVEKGELEALEAVVERGLVAFVEVGDALRRIRDARLYRFTHGSFEDYCQQRWSLERVYAHRLMKGAETVRNLLPIGNILPTNEAQVRPLALLKDPEEQRAAWEEASVGGTVTAAQVSKVVRERLRSRKQLQAHPVAERSPRLIVGLADWMPEIDDVSVDLIITSPPYKLGDDTWPMGGDGRIPRNEGIGYDDRRDREGYVHSMLAGLREMWRVARPGASLFYNHKPRTVGGKVIHPVEWLVGTENPWRLRQEIIWDRGSTHNHCATLFWPHDERIYWMTKGHPVLPDRPIGMSTVWQFHGPVANTWHPAPFAEELPRRIIEAVGRGGVLLDPYAGSCTTLVVGLKYGYECIGVDMSKEYLRTAKEEQGWTTELEVSRALTCVTPAYPSIRTQAWDHGS